MVSWSSDAVSAGILDSITHARALGIDRNELAKRIADLNTTMTGGWMNADSMVTVLTLAISPNRAINSAENHVT